MPADLLPGVSRRRRVLVVLGMHRGGTSAVAGMLHRLGVDFGPRLMPANADNPAGYYEHNDVVNLHDRFLGRLGAAWDDPFPPAFEAPAWAALAPAAGLPTYREELISILRRDFDARESRFLIHPWGIKDPRLCLLLPWWEPVWTALGSEPYFLLVLRSPEAVAASLSRRDGFSVAKSHLLWLQHLLRAEKDTRGRPRGFLNYDAFVADWRGTLAGVDTALGEPWPHPPATLSPEDLCFLDPSLRHHRSSRPEHMGSAPSSLGSWVETAYRAVSADPAKAGSDLDAITDELGRAGQLMAPIWRSQGQDFGVQLQAQRRLTRWYEEEWQKSLLQAQGSSDRLTKQLAKARELQDKLDRQRDTSSKSRQSKGK